MKFKQFVFFSSVFFFGLQTYAQRNYEGYNFLGIQGGVAIFDIQTDDLQTNSKAGFLAGFTTRGGFRNDFDLIYGLSFQSLSVGIEASPVLGAETQTIDYTVQGVQLNFLGSYNIIMKHLSIEAGPVFVVNGKMKLDNKKYENYTISGYETLAAKEIQEISRFNVRIAGGITTGLEHFRISAQYQYGLTNILGNLNSEDLEYDDFKGNSSTFVISGVIYF